MWGQFAREESLLMLIWALSKVEGVYVYKWVDGKPIGWATFLFSIFDQGDISGKEYYNKTCVMSCYIFCSKDRQTDLIIPTPACYHSQYQKQISDTKISGPYSPRNSNPCRRLPCFARKNVCFLHIHYHHDHHVCPPLLVLKRIVTPEYKRW